MTQLQQVKTLEQLGVDFAGFIFYKNSPRYVLGDKAAADSIISSNLNIKKVGVFVDEPLEDLLKIASKWNLDYVQLHGDESPEFCKILKNHFPVIKAFRVGDNVDVLSKTVEYNEVDYFLFDTLGQKYGGTGEKFNWNQLLVTLHKPYFLSGGIGPEDSMALNEFEKKANQLFALDLNSKFEDLPGVKNIEKIKLFLEQLKNS